MKKRQMTLIALIGYVNDFNKLQRFKVSVKKPTIDFNALLTLR